MYFWNDFNIQYLEVSLLENTRQRIVNFSPVHVTDTILKSNSTSVSLRNQIENCRKIMKSREILSMNIILIQQ